MKTKEKKKMNVLFCNAVLLIISKKQLYNGNPDCVPESARFLKNLPATHPTSMFYLYKSSFRLKKEIFLVRTLHLFTCI